MSDAITPDDSFTSAAGRQLFIFAALAIGAITLLMLGLSWASSLTGSASGGNNAVNVETNTLTVFLREEPPQLNSSLSTDQVSGSVLGHVVEGLLRYDEHNQLAPAVAERWELREHGATFWLREDALWSDGKPVTAHDFVFGWRTGLDPAIDQISKLKSRMSASIIGQDDLVERMLVVLLADGNMLLEGLPGLAKTRAIKSLANELNCGLSRIQFTPDLLPSDVTGTEIYQPESQEKFIFQQGPIFSNLILADEINRAPAKVQSALLEAMEERQVTVSGKSYKMDPLFMVMATQNPVEQEGTYPLPEAQMDRFLMHVIISYPDDQSELEIMRLNRDEQSASNGAAKTEKIDQQVIFDARNEIAGITISEEMEKYMVDLISATRYPEKYDKDLKDWLDYGASPRGTIALDRSSRAHAWLSGNDFVTPDSIRAVVHDCLRHRLILSYEANAEGITADQVIDKILEQVAVIG